MPLAGITAAGLGSVTTATPQEFMYTGVMENLYGGPTEQVPIDLADLNPGIIRMLRGEDNALGSPASTGTNRILTIPRSIDIINAGIQLMPAIRTEFSSTSAFTTYLTTWIEALEANTDDPPLWYEIGNEPAPVSGQTQATARANYITKMNAASTVLDSYGKKLILSAITGAAGGTDAMLSDIWNDGAGSGATFSKIDGFAIHPYTVYASDTGPSNGSYTSVAGYRNLFNANAAGGGASHGYNQDAKPLFITEIGWSCANRADGAQHGDWNGQAPEMLSTDISITQAQQADRITTAFNDLKAHRAKSDLYLKAIIYFTYHDYGLPNENWDRHCGLVDKADGRRSSYSTLRGLQRSFTIGP